MNKTTSGINFEQRQIFNALVSFSDGSGAKKRPVLIISHNNHNKSSDDVICCPITSNANGFGRIIYPADYEVKNLTLPVSQSQIKSQHPMFIHKSKLEPLTIGRVKINKDLAKKVVQDINDCIST